MICVQWCTLNNTSTFTFSNLHNNSIFRALKLKSISFRVELKLKYS